MKPTVLLVATVALAGGCNLSIGSEYAAEVGYYRGEAQEWDIWGAFNSLEDCRAAAIERFNSLNRESPGRAFSWACLKKNSGGGYDSRHR